MRKRGRSFYRPINPYSAKKLREKDENELAAIIQEREADLLRKRREITVLQERLLRLSSKENEYSVRLKQSQSVDDEIATIRKQLSQRTPLDRFVGLIVGSGTAVQLETRMRQLEKTKRDIDTWLRSFNADTENNPIALRRIIENEANKVALIQKTIQDCHSVIASRRREAEFARKRDIQEKEEEEKLRKREEAERQKEEARKREAEERLRKRKEESKRIRARLAAYDGKTRRIASEIKRQLERYDCCPYCFRSLGEDAEADHIIPITLGGLSIESNMVYVCRDCNQKKGNLTIREFCEKFERNRAEIEEILIKMGKRI